MRGEMDRQGAELRKNSPEKYALAWLVRRHAGVRPAWIKERLKMGTATGFAHFLGRLEGARKGEGDMRPGERSKSWGERLSAMKIINYRTDPYWGGVSFDEFAAEAEGGIGVIGGGAFLDGAGVEAVDEFGVEHGFAEVADEGGGVVAEETEPGGYDAGAEEGDGFFAAVAAGGGDAFHGEGAGASADVAAAFDEGFEEGGFAAHVEGGADDEGVGGVEGGIDGLHIVLDDAAGQGFGGVVVAAGHAVAAVFDMPVDEGDFFGGGAGGGVEGAGDGAVDEGIDGASFAVAGHDGDDFHGDLLG